MSQDEQFIKMQEQLSNLDRKVDKITVVLVGDDFTEEGGFVARVKVLENKVSKLEKVLDNIKYFALGGALFSGYGIYELLKNIIAVVNK